MISLNDVLLAMSNIPVDDPIAEIWGRGLQGGYKIIEYTDSLPITITANGDALLDYRIYGASGGVGVRTENLFDKNATNTDNGFIAHAYVNRLGNVENYWSFNVSEYISIKPNTAYYAQNVSSTNVSYCSVCFYTADHTFISAISYTFRIDIPFTTPANAAYIRMSVRIANLDIITLTEGTEPPTSYIPYGYKLPMTVIDNLAPPLSQWIDGYINAYGELSKASITLREKASDFIEVKSNTKYVFSIEGGAFPQGTSASWAAVGFYRDDQTFIDRYSTGKKVPYTFLTPPEIKYVRLSYRSYGELWEPRLSESSFSIPVYIGENQLDAGEYVSYGEQKIYRDVDGTLTPTDPPVSLPQIPTIDGTTIIDYDGDPKPSQMYVKYKDKSDGA